MQVIAPDIEAVKADEFFDDNTVLLDEEEARIVVTPEAVTVSHRYWIVWRELLGDVVRLACYPSGTADNTGAQV